MRLLLVLTIVLLSTTADAQVRRDSLYRFIRAQEGVTLPDSSQWYNSKKAFTVFDIPDRLLFVHVWNPFDVRGKESMQRMNQLREENKDFVIVTIIPDSLCHDCEEKEVAGLIERFEIRHPVIIAPHLTSLKLNKKDPLPVITIVRDDGRRAGYFAGDEMLDDFELDLVNIRNAAEDVMGLNKLDFSGTVSGRTVYGPLDYSTAIVSSRITEEAYIADEGNNRILVVSNDGTVTSVIGSGTRGFRDGRTGACLLDRPGGLAIDEESGVLYISDTYNHVIRKVDLETDEVTTILGNGKRAYGQQKWVDSTSAPLNHPRGLTLAAGKLFIAMAGNNQIWEYDFKTKRARAVAGDGVAESRDGERGQSSFHTPVAIDQDSNGNFWVLDRGSGKLRKLSNNFTVETIDLFPGEGNKLFSPEGILCHKGKVYIADAWNNRILVYDGGSTKVLSGIGISGFVDGKGSIAAFNKPVGIAVNGKSLWVIDQFNNRLRTVNPKNGKAATLNLTGYKELFANYNAYSGSDTYYFDEIIIGPGTNTIYIDVKLDKDYEMVESGRNEVTMDRAGFNRLLNSDISRGFIEIQTTGKEMNSNAQFEVYVTVREKATGKIVFRPILMVIPYVYDESGGKEHDLVFDPMFVP